MVHESIHIKILCPMTSEEQGILVKLKLVPSD